MVRLLIAALSVCLTTSAKSDLFMHVTSTSQPPIGYVAYCETTPKYCQPKGSDKRFTVTAKRLSELDTVNRFVNTTIDPVSDKETYGVDEFWAVPIKQGDCEDYALLKQQMLISLGWPSNALLLTVVYDEKHMPHAVLTARTSQGDFVLDNKTNQVRLWYQFPYHFVSRQSTTDPKVWYSLE